MNLLCRLGIHRPVYMPAPAPHTSGQIATTTALAFLWVRTCGACRQPIAKRTR